MTDSIVTNTHHEKGSTRIMQEDYILNELQKTDTLPSSPFEQRSKSGQDNLVKNTKLLEVKMEHLYTGWKSYNDIASWGDLMQISDIDQLKLEMGALFKTSLALEDRHKELELELKAEHGHSNLLRHDNQVLRQMTVDLTAHAEQAEEFISNKLLKRISKLKKEREELLLKVEQEEEYLTNMLQKKLTQLQKEKVDLENTLEQEQEFIVNKLQKQLDSMRILQSSPTRGPVDVSPIGLPSISPTISAFFCEASPSFGAKNWVPGYSSTTYGDFQMGQLDVLKAEASSLKIKASEMHREYILKHQQCTKYKDELVQLRIESGLSADDLMLDDSFASVFRSVPSSPKKHARTQRSTSTSSLRSTLSEKNSIPQLQLDNSTSSSTQHSDGKRPSHSRGSSIHTQHTSDEYVRSRSTSISSASGSSSLRRDGRRVSINQFGFFSPPPQHPPQL